MNKTIFLLLSILIFNFGLQPLNAMFSDSESFDPSPLFALSDPENDSSVEYENIFVLQKYRKQSYVYSEIERSIKILIEERRRAINMSDNERVVRIDEEISGLNKLIRYNLKRNFILFIKSTCPIF